MANINISEFKRPGIYLREIDNSVRQVPNQSALNILVVGFSRKGQINKPVLIETPQQLIETFGDIDRLLEKRGCFFHRTILNCLRNAPVWALNILKTDETLDTIEYQSISVASDVPNSIVKTAPYEQFFDRSDFWSRDTDAFLALANSNLTNQNQILHITNLSDKRVTVFVYKATVEGYNDTLDIYYNGTNNVPLYVSPKDQAKDYILSVVIVQGDWSDYNTLSVDNKWGKFFNKSGLIKNQIGNFINDSAVTVLKTYTDVSIIPYFKDLKGREVFIETVINNDTDLHGVFVTYDIDKVESTEYRTGLLDLVGMNLIDSSNEVINYLSYSETINEKLTFTSIVNDRAGNAFGKNLQFETLKSDTPTYTIDAGVGSSNITLTNTFDYILNGKKITTTGNSVNVQDTSIGKRRKDTIYLDENGAIGILKGIEVSNLTDWLNVPLKPVTSTMLPITILNVDTAILLTPIDIIDIPVITFGTNVADSVYIQYLGLNEVKFTFTDTSNTDSDINYKKTILNKVFADLQSKTKSEVSIIIDSTGNKVSITNFVFNTVATADKSLVINVSPSLNISRGDDAKIYFIDDEQILETSGAETSGYRTTPTLAVHGTVSQYSTIYKQFKDGLINSSDYFYPSLGIAGKTEFLTNSGNDIIKLYYNVVGLNSDILTTKLIANFKIKIIGTQYNDNVYTILSVAIIPSTGDYNTRIELIVNENIVNETVTSNVTVTDADAIRYLKMYFIGKSLYVDFSENKDLSSVNGLLNLDYFLENIFVYSNKSNYKQTIEIESVLDTNRVLVDASRYGELKIGDYLQAFVDTDTLQPNEKPRRFTRIIDKRAYSGDTTLSEIRTDSAIDILSFGTDKQTYRFTTIEDYVNTYKAITLKGFKMRENSMPNGTEERQSEILDMIANNTPIFKGLVNRNKLSWRYLVDCWGLGLTSNSKHQLVDLCGERLTTLGLLNMPSAKSFKNSTSPSFLTADKSLSTDYIRKGGNPESNPNFLYTFASGKGQSNVAYFFPYVTIQDNGRPLQVPPSLFVIDSFMRKHTSRLASIKPWTIVAGINDGFVNGIGNVEMDLTPDDIGNLNLMGANPIVYKMNRGFCIETNNTAQIVPLSSLSRIHAREVLVELENELYEMLLTYQWKFNTAEIRKSIKDSADAICSRYVRDNGLYAFANIMDESNNTSELIDNQIGVLDTFVEIIQGMGIIVNNISILKTGSISSGFTNA